MFSPEALEQIRENLKLEFCYNNCYDDAVEEKLRIKPVRLSKNARKVQTASTDLRKGMHLRAS